MACPRVWPKLRRRRSPRSSGSRSTTPILAAAAPATTGPRTAGSPARSASRLSSTRASSSGSSSAAILITSTSPERSSAAGERRQERGVADRHRRMMEQADGVLSAGQVDPGLAADRSVHLGEEGRRDLDEFEAAQEAAGHEAGEIADAAAAEREHAAVALAAGVEHRVPQPPGRGHRSSPPRRPPPPAPPTAPPRRAEAPGVPRAARGSAPS